MSEERLRFDMTVIKKSGHEDGKNAGVEFDPGGKAI